MISVTKIAFIFFVISIQTIILFAQDSNEEQFNYAKQLYEEEKYFDAVTEFKRLLYFDESDIYSFEANYLMGLSCKFGGKLF